MTKPNTDTVAIEGPAKARSTFTAEPSEETTVDGSTKLTEKAEAAIEAEHEALGVKVEPEKTEPHLHFDYDATPPSLAPRVPRRRDILDDADDKIMGDRRVEYGDAQENFERIAALWTALDLHIGNREYTAAQVALMLDLLKTARLAVNPTHTDSWVDKAGYSALGAEVAGA